MKAGTIARTVDLAGIVQGVGLRPSLFAAARRAGLGGWVQNRSGVVRLRVEGAPDDVAAFFRDLRHALPALARLESVREVACEPLAAGGGAEFQILPSESAGRPTVVIPSDLAVCGDCAREVLDPADRRFGYPFTTCTRCGPRYTVVESMPYDRERTTLAPFVLCPACRAEYTDPGNRRFHAESVACPACGPRLALRGERGEPLPGEALRGARAALGAGLIVAARGIGGFLLAADAHDRSALARLRSRKGRPHKPFAVMAPDLDAVRKYCVVPPEAQALLASPQAPVMILDVRRDALELGLLPFDLLTPDAPTLGVMLPTSPLHLLLFKPQPGDETRPFDLLVMTSGNRGGEPICLSNEEALDRLSGIADRFLCHDREINLRADDSVAVLQRGLPQVWRRARGYAPDAVSLARPLRRTVLAMGADLKNAVAVAYEARAVLSAHVGDIETPEALDGLARVARALPQFLERPAEVVAVDLHPDMQSTRLGLLLAEEWGLPSVAVQHHHAHAAAAFAEFGVESGLALVMDGTGLGSDGRIWGAELLAVSPGACKRLATFAPVWLPGGDAAVQRPARQVVARWLDAGVAPAAGALRRLRVSDEEADVWRQQCLRGVNAPLTHAAGRLFDAFSAALGLAPTCTTYEGQAAIRLEWAARQALPCGACRGLPYALAERDGLLMVEWKQAFVRLAEAAPEAVSEWALAAHRAVADAAWDMVQYGLTRVGSEVVALTGGVFMNRILNELLAPRLEAAGLRVLTPRCVPPNDGGIALGQAVVAGGGE